MPKKPAAADPHAMALMNQARSYIRAAKLLVPHVHENPEGGRSLADPLYFLSIHALELAMKASLI